MVISNRTLRMRLHGQFHRHVFTAEWVWMGIFCFASFYSTFKLIFIFEKSIKLLLQKPLTPDLNFPMSRVVKIWTAAAIFQEGHKLSQSTVSIICFLPSWHCSGVSIAIYRCPYSDALLILGWYKSNWGFPGGSNSKASAWISGDPVSITGSGRSPGEGNGYPLQYSLPGEFHEQRT